MKQRKHHREDGFTLLELLLVVGVSAILLLGISQITQSWIDSEVASGAGQHLQRTSTRVQKYIEANWATLSPTSDALNDPAWATLKTQLQDDGLIVNNKLHNPLGTDLQISYVVDVSGTSPIYRASIFAKTPLPAQKILDAARQAGNAGGTIAHHPDPTRATGAFGQWSVAKTQMMPGGTDPCPASSAPNSTKGCLAAVVSFNGATLAGPYLYREDMGDPLLNTMNTDLQMNNHSITNANSVTTQNADVAQNANLGNTTVNGTATFNSDTTVTNGMTVTNDINVTGDANFANNVTMNAANINTKDLHADMVQAPVLRTNNLDTQNVTVNNGEVTVNDNVNVNGDVNMTNGEVFANTVNAGAVNANSGAIKVGSVDVQNTMTVTGTVHVNNNTMVINRLVTNHCVKIDDGTNTGVYNNYGTCP